MRGPNDSALQRLHCNDLAMIQRICGTKDWNLAFNILRQSFTIRGDARAGRGQDALESGSMKKLFFHQKQGSHPHTIPSSVRQQSFWPFLQRHQQKFSWLSWLCQLFLLATPDRKWLPGSSVGPPYWIRKPWSLVLLLPLTMALTYTDADGPTTIRGPVSLAKSPDCEYYSHLFSSFLQLPPGDCTMCD